MSKRQGPLLFKRSFAVPRERVFRAWTDPEEVKKWWLLGQGWRLNIVEVNLRVGGRYRIGLISSENNAKHSVMGVFKEISVPSKLVYTWKVEGVEEESLVTVEFRDLGSSTELVLTHDLLAAGRESTLGGWVSVLDGLGNLMERG